MTMPDSLALPRLRAALARLKEVGDRATPGPWTYVAKPLEVRIDGPDDRFDIAELDGTYPDGRAVADAEFIVAARDLPAADLLGLVGEVERLREACKLTMERCRACDGDGEVMFYESDPEKGEDLSHYEPCWVCGPIRAALSAPAPDGEARPDGR
jgi:hypothetical protein